MNAFLLGAALIPMLAVPQQPAKPPVIVEAVVHQFEDGPPLGASETFVAGETVFFSFQVRGYAVSGDGQVQFTYRVEVTDTDGVAVVGPKTGKIETRISDLDKDWLPKVRCDFVIPSHALPGKFRVTAAIDAGQSGPEAKSETVFGVRGRQVDTAGPLAIRNLQFFRGEDDRTPLATPTYKSGEVLSVHFDITGFQHADKNRIGVSYGISIIGPTGKILFSEPRAAADEDSSFYPKRYVPGVASLTVQPKTPPGEYLLVITARDQVGGVTSESRGVFRVE